jgi:hypothetical protein
MIEADTMNICRLVTHLHFRLGDMNALRHRHMHAREGDRPSFQRRLF